MAARLSAAPPSEFSSAGFVKRLLLGTLFLNAIVAVLGALSLLQSHDHHEQRAVVTTQNLARVLEQDLKATFDRIDLTVLSVKDEVEEQLAAGGVRGPVVSAYLAKQLARQSDLDGVRVANAEGEVLYGTGVPDKPGISVAEREFFRELKASPALGLVVSRPIVGQISGKWSIALARRLNRPDGSFAGVAYAVVLLEKFQTKFARLDLGARGAVSLRDLELGTVVRQPEPNAIGSAVGNRTYSKEWPEKLKQNGMYGTYFAVGLDGRNRALSFRRIEGYPFYIIVGLFPGDYLVEWWQELWKTLALLAAFAVVTGIFSWIVIKSWRRREADSRRLLELSQLALRQSEQQLQIALDGAEMGVWAWNPATREFAADAQAKRLHGLAAHVETTQQSVLGSIDKDDRARVAALLDVPRSSAEPLETELRIIDPSGQLRWLSWRGRWIAGAESDARVITGVVQDITGVKRSEERKDEFLAMLAHELRNPLAAIRNALQIIGLSSDPHVLDRARVIMERQVANIVRLVDDLFDVSRISQGKLHLQTAIVDLASVLTNAAETSRPLFDKARHELKLHLPADKVLLNADATRLEQVVSNLLNNAARYTPDAGVIELHVDYSRESVRIRVVDSGIGIPKDMLPHVFEMFTQVDQGIGRTQGGLGIGLTLVKQLVELHGGTVQALSEGRGRGSEFIVTLPVASVEPRAVTPAGGRAAAPLRPGAARKVLIVDDNRDSAHSLAMMFQLMGHSTATAYNGEDAVDTAAKFEPDVVLLDLGLPKMNGYEAARKIRQTHGKNVTLVALTGWAQERDRNRSMEAGFDHYLVKPAQRVDLEQLLG